MNLSGRFEYLRRIWVLRETLNAGSIRKAAVRIKVTPSAVSQNLKALEKSLNKPVVVRSAKAFTLTPEGQRLLEQAEPLLNQLEHLNDTSQRSELRISSLTLGTYESLAIRLLPVLAHALENRFPGIQLITYAGRSDHLITRVRSGELCIALVTEGASLSRLKSTQMGTDRLGFFVSHSGSKTCDFITLLKKKKWGSISTPASGMPTYLSRFLRKVGDIGKPTFLSDSLEAVRCLTESGEIIGLLPTKVATQGSAPLREITPEAIIRSDANGTHKILLVSGAHCDLQEHDLLADMCKPLLS